jgi:L-lactate dehydrogenase complex protein LldE
VRVALFVTCLVDLVAPEVGVATARVLQRAGHEVIFPEDQTCCGQPAFNSGHRSEAAKVLRATLRALAAARADAYVAPAGSCTAMIRTFARQLADSPELEYVAPRLFELSEFLAAHGGALAGRVAPRRVAYHDSCHMLRELGLEREPRAALGRTLDAATTVCGADPSCLMHLRGRLRKLGRDVEVRHLAELLEEGTRGDAARA